MSRGLMLWNALMLLVIFKQSGYMQALWYIYPDSPIYGKDFYASWLIQSRMMLDGAFADIWVPQLNEAWQRAHGIRPLFNECPYPPLLAILTMPLTGFEVRTAVDILLYVNMTLGLLSGTALTAWALGPRARTPSGAVTALFTGIAFTLGAPNFDTLVSGQAGLLTLSLTGLFAWAFSAQRPRLAAAILSLAVSLKVYPAIFLLWPLMRRDWKFLGWFSLGMLVWTLPVWLVAGRHCPELLLTYITKVAPRAAAVSAQDAYTNQSVANVLGRWTGNHGLGRLISLAVLGLGAATVYRLPHHRRGLFHAMALCSLLQLLALGRSWPHYHGVLFLAGVCLWKAEARHNLHLFWFLCAGIVYHFLMTGEFTDEATWFRVRLPLFEAGVPCWITLALFLGLAGFIWTNDWKSEPAHQRAN